MKILLTGFEPFGGEKINPSWEVVKSIGKMKFNGVDLAVRQMPTSFIKATEALHRSLIEEKPVVFIGLGQAGGRPSINLEMLAINIRDATNPDNNGYQPGGEPIDAEGPAAYFSNLPVRKLVNELKEKGIPAQVSYFPGTFVCNELFYSALNYQAKHKTPLMVGYLHIPYLPAQAVNHPKAPSMGIDMIIEGLKIIIAGVSEKGNQ